MSELIHGGLRLDPNGLVFVFIERHLPFLLAKKEWIALGLLALGGLKVTGATGLMIGRPWAYYLLVALLILLLPSNISLAASVTPTSAATSPTCSACLSTTTHQGE